jgi:hypothetical protein
VHEMVAYKGGHVCLSVHRFHLWNCWMHIEGTWYREYTLVQCKAWICVTLAFGCEPCRMFSVNQRFGKHCSCHFQGEIIHWSPAAKTYGQELQYKAYLHGLRLNLFP